MYIYIYWGIEPACVGTLRVALCVCVCVCVCVAHPSPGGLRLRRTCGAAAAARLRSCGGPKLPCLLSFPASAGMRAFRGG